MTINLPAPQAERVLMERAVSLARQSVSEEGTISPKGRFASTNTLLFLRTRL
jgi:hypothetical protein